MNNSPIIVYDMETGGLDTETCEILQIAAVVVEPRSLSVVTDSQFNCYFRPLDVKNVHAKALEKNKLDLKFLVEKGVSLEVGWKSFVDYCKKYSGSPIACGYNIRNYDNLIVERLLKKYGPKKTQIFQKKHIVDLIDLMFLWFENNADITSYSLDNLRDYFGISKEGAHNAIKDVDDCANILIRFLKFHRAIAAKQSFKGKFKQ